jgi:hypothetical protein
MLYFYLALNILHLAITIILLSALLRKCGQVVELRALVSTLHNRNKFLEGPVVKQKSQQS